MRIVVENCLTKLYLTAKGTWTTVLAEAKIFSTSFDAFHFCEDHRVPNSHVVFRFDHSALRAHV
jgi:hypothetical protein